MRLNVMDEINPPVYIPSARGFPSLSRGHWKLLCPSALSLSLSFSLSSPQPVSSLRIITRKCREIVNATKRCLVNFVVRPRKPELIIRENEPKELPPDVVRGNRVQTGGSVTKMIKRRSNDRPRVEHSNSCLTEFCRLRLYFNICWFIVNKRRTRTY